MLRLKTPVCIHYEEMQESLEIQFCTVAPPCGKCSTLNPRFVVLPCSKTTHKRHTVNSTHVHSKAILHCVVNFHYSAIHVLATFIFLINLHQVQRKPAYSFLREMLAGGDVTLG